MSYQINTAEKNYIKPTVYLQPQHALILQPQIPVTQQLEDRFYIQTQDPNPFTVRPIQTEWKTNELIMIDPKSRVIAGMGPLDIGLKQASNYISPQHLNM